MEAPRPVGPVVQRPDVRRVTGGRGGGQGGFERAFDRQREAPKDDDEAGDAAQEPAPPALQPRRPAGRKNQGDGGHRIDVVV